MRRGAEKHEYIVPHDFSRRKAEMAAGIDVCKLCHNTVHDLIPNEKELGRDYYSFENLVAHPQIAKYLAWKQSRRQRI